ncbi:Chloroperoxidase [Ilyonectria robusta]|uniref:Chloroperoxidase n=1 Tax=Ilyonectria robusta TaxID=1079257 RepID=UPI001E8CD71F|nr:Chloroperoxidase [Ilyonectria robusta]KAH8694733.1 Chloroperoxidase [Ilyonectria robusta]
MASSTTRLSAPLARGVYARSGPNDLRSPCPMINSLANHGYLPRDGRNARLGDFTSAMNEVGLSSVLGAMFSNPIFLEHKKSALANAAATKPRSFLGSVWYFVCNPWAIAFSAFGMRMPGQVDSTGERVLNLDQLGLPNVVEHDVSLSRRDYNQGDNSSAQQDLVSDILASSSNGKTLTAEDLAALRRRRIERQKEDNPELLYGPLQHELSCGEIALLLKVLGDGDKVPCDYIRAVFQEERLPIQEGWEKRRWWTLGIVELKATGNKVKKLIGLEF